MPHRSAGLCLKEREREIEREMREAKKYATLMLHRLRVEWNSCHVPAHCCSTPAPLARSFTCNRVLSLIPQICRNYFGAQKSSFEVPLDTSALELESGDKESDKTTATEKMIPYPAVFIRAPAVLEASS